MSGIIAISSGRYDSHNVALKSDGSVWSWGGNRFGDVCNGNSSTNAPTPFQVTGLGNIIQVAAGGDFILALKSDGTVWSCGGNGSGELGDGTTTARYAPVRVQGPSGVKAIAAANTHGLAIKSDGTVWTWGANFVGQLGNNSTTDSAVPVQTSGLSGVTAVVAGRYHSAALKIDGTVWAWGWNQYGQLGNNSTTNSSVPVQAQSGVTRVISGSDYVVSLKSDGSVWAWGSNNHGQLANSSTTDSHVPVQVSALHGMLFAGAGDFHTLVAMAPSCPGGSACASNAASETSATNWQPESATKVQIPTGLVGTGSTYTFTYTSATTGGSAPSHPLGSLTQAGSHAFSLAAADQNSASVSSFPISYTLQVSYTDAEIPTGHTAAQLGLYYWDANTSAWTAVPSTVDTTTHTVTATLNHLTDFALLAGSGGGSSGSAGSGGAGAASTPELASLALLGAGAGRAGRPRAAPKKADIATGRRSGNRSRGLLRPRSWLAPPLIAVPLAASATSTLRSV